MLCVIPIELLFCVLTFDGSVALFYQDVPGYMSPNTRKTLFDDSMSHPAPGACPSASDEAMWTVIGEQTDFSMTAAAEPDQLSACSYSTATTQGRQSILTDSILRTALCILHGSGLTASNVLIIEHKLVLRNQQFDPKTFTPLPLGVKVFGLT